MSEYDTCRVCGAAVDNMSRHRSWHAEVQRDIPNARREARRNS